MRDSTRGVGSTKRSAGLLGITGRVLIAAAIWACGLLAPAHAQVDLHCRTALPQEVSVPPAPPDSTPPLLPPPAVPRIPDGDDIILYLHGGPGSRLEEASDLAKPLLDAGPAVGRQFTLIVFDQPSQGYTEHQDPLCVAQPHSQIGDVYPLVQFNEDFVVAFVDALDRVTPIKNRNIYIIGGSTGGMLALRMGHRSEPWITKIVAWNPASVWSTFAHDVFKGVALTEGFNRAEVYPPIRKEFFDQAFGPQTLPPFLPNVLPSWQPNPEEWYRGDRDKYPANAQIAQKPFRPEWRCKWDYIASGRLEMQEVYSEPFRRWHWRFGTEELLFSFFNDSWTGPANNADKDSPNVVYKSIVRPTLLMASDDDDWNEVYVPADKVAELSAVLGAHVGGPVGALLGVIAGAAHGPVYVPGELRLSQTNMMGQSMQKTPGSLVLVYNTGHSIHNERPKLLAAQIAAFVSSTTSTTVASQPTSIPQPPLSDEPCNSDFTTWSPVFKTPSLDYPDGRFPEPIRQLLDSGDATHNPADYLKQKAQLGGSFTDGSSAGTYNLELRPDLRAIAQKRDPASALVASALAHDQGDVVTAKAMADLAVTGRYAYSAFVHNPPGNSDLISRLASLLPSVQVPGPQFSEYNSCRMDKEVACHGPDKQQCVASADSGCRTMFPNAFKMVPPAPERLAADVDFAKTRALQVAWALRNPNTQKAFHDRSALGWIAVSAEDDPPDRPVNVPSGIPTFEPDGKTQIGYYPQFDLPVTVALSYPGAKTCNPAANPCTVTFVTRYTIASGPRPPHHLTGETVVSGGVASAAVNSGSAVSLSTHSAPPATPANSGMLAVLSSKFSVAALPVSLLSASACLTVDGATCLPANTPAPAVGQPRRAIVTVKSAGKPVSGVQVSVAIQGVTGQTSASGTALIRYAGCFATTGAQNDALKPKPCQAVLQKPGFAPNAVDLP